MINALVNNYVNDRIRPVAEATRKLFAKGVDAKQSLNNLVPVLVAGGYVQVELDGSLTALQPNEIIEDGREGQGIYQLTIGDFCYIMNVFVGLINAIDADDDFKTKLVKASVRSLD